MKNTEICNKCRFHYKYINESPCSINIHNKNNKYDQFKCDQFKWRIY